VNTTDTKAVLGHMIDLQMQRVTRARNMELIDGGMLTKPLREKWIALHGSYRHERQLVLTDFLFVMPVVRVVAKAAEYSLNFRRWR
jgi:hypothetical protein